jgi:hypothetical protein
LIRDFQEEDIRLYSCLANGSADEFVKGEHMLKIKAVKDPLQIGASFQKPYLQTKFLPRQCLNLKE